jgi:hypothetical protein
MAGIASELIQKREHLERDRSVFEQHWAEVAPLVLPRQDEFFNSKKKQGERRTSKKFDDTATLALDHGAAAIEGVVSPRGSQWHGIGLPTAIEDDQASQEWSDRLAEFLFKKRYAATSNFASQLHEVYLSLLAFGTGIMIVEDMPGHGIRYKSGHIAEHCYMENAYGRIDVNYRKYRLTARQAHEKFKDKAPKCVLKCLDKEPSKKLDFLHVVQPDDDGETGMPFISYHVAIEDNELIDVGGFHSFPYIISRWTTSPNEIYGRSPAMSVLSEIKMLNAMRKTDLRARHLAVDPPILAANELSVRRFSMKNGKLNYGTLDMNGNPLVRPYQSGVSIPTSNDGMEQSREFINRAFFLNLFQILVDAPQMTATEVLQRAQEKGQLLTPTAGRQMSELLEPMIMREIAIYEEYGIFEDGQFLELPDAMKEQGGAFDIVYTNPLSRMMRSEEALGAERTIQSLLPMAQIDQSILDRVDWKEYGDLMRDANGAPAKLFHSDEEMAQIAQARQQQQQQQQILEAAPQVAGAVKDIAQAQSFE